MVSFDPSKPASAYSLASSSSDLKVPSSLAALLHGTLIAVGMWPGRWLCSCGRWAGARILPENSVADRPDSVVGRLGGVRRRGPVHCVLRQRPGVELPLLATTVEQLHVIVAVELEVPVRVGGEPVVVAAVEDNGVVVGDTAVTEQLGELLGVDEVTPDGVL